MKRLLKISGIFFLALIAILFAMYFYLANNQERLIKSIVASQSNGRFSVDMKKIDLNLWQLRLEVLEPHFSSTDSINLPTTFDIKLDRMVIDLTSLRPLIFESKIQIDTIVFMRPQITAFKWKNKAREKLSLTEAMGNVYSTLNDIVKKLNIKYCVIDSGTFTLINKLNRESKPVTISDYYLRIDNLKADSKSDTGNRSLFSDRIKFYSSHQDIVFPDGIHGIKYSRLRINSLRQSIEIDSCYLYGKQAADGFKEFGIFFDTLKLSQVDFNKLTQSRLISADSAICKNPVIHIHTERKAKKNPSEQVKKYQSRDSMEMSFKALLGNIDVKYIGVLNAKFEMQAKTENKITSYTSEKNDFIIENVTIINDPKIPLKVGGLYFGLNAYRAFNDDSTYFLKFDSIIFRNRKINLANFTISTTEKNKVFVGRRELKMRSLEIEEFNWLELIFNKRVMAGEVALLNPEISLDLKGKKPATTKTTSTIYNIFHKALRSISFQTLKIRDASVDIQTGNQNHYALENVNAEIGVDLLLRSNNLNELTRALTAITFSGVEMSIGLNNIKLGKGVLNGKTKTISVSTASIKNNKKSTSVTLEDFHVENFRQNNPDHLGISGISWSKAEFIINPEFKKQNNTSQSSATANGLHLEIDKLYGRNTTLKIISPQLNAAVILETIKSNKVEWEPKKKPVIHDLAVNGKSIDITNQKINLSSQQFSITDMEPSFINRLNIRSIINKDTISVNTPQLAFTPNIVSLISGKPEINDVVLKNPEFRFNSTGDTSNSKNIAKKNGKLPSLSINQLSILNPVILSLTASLSKTIKASELRSEWHMSDIAIDSNQLFIGGFRSSVQGFSADTKKLNVSLKGEGKLNIDLGAIRFSPANEQNAGSWSAKINAVSANNLALKTSRNDTINNNINLHSFHIENMSLNSGEKLNIYTLLKNNEGLRISKGNISLVSTKSNLMVSGLRYDQIDKKISFDSFYVKPVPDRESFMKSKVWQTDYLEFNTGRTEISGIDQELFLRDSIIYARKIESRNAGLSVYKDKRLPFDFSKIKPLPTTLIQNIRKKIQIDSIRLTNTNITYEEFNEKTLMLGAVHFNRSQLLVQGVKNFALKSTDSLRVSATTWLMDSAFLRLRFNESYLDTLHAFLFAIRMRPFNLSVLNPMLEPLASLKITSGRVDTIRLNAIGREYVAHGKMKMYYSGLKAQYLKKGDENVKTLKTRLINFAANDLILRHKNKRGYGEVYAERVRERSVFNYWLKMAISGMMSSTGVKSNKKQEKKYQKSIRKLNVPEIPEVIL